MNFVTNIADFTIDVASFIGNVSYQGIDIVFMSGIFIIHLDKSYDDKMKIHDSIMNECNFWCKNKYNDICYEVGWKTCELITHCKQFHKKIIIPSFHNVTSNYFKPCVFLINHGIEVMAFTSWDQYESCKNENTIDQEYDTVLYTQYDMEEDSKRNYTVIGDHKLKSPDSNLKHKSNISFILFQLTTEGTKYDISLKEPMNFFIKDNTLNYTFFKWYMKRIYNIELSEYFSINYMTGDMSIANLHNPFYIKFNDDGVTSFSSGKRKESNAVLHEDNEDNEDNEDKEYVDME